MILAAYGCFISMYGCPNHGGPVDGHALTTESIYRDSYAERQGAAHNEGTCLRKGAYLMHQGNVSITVIHI
ncbi:hypothetical protein DPMN_182719 [Dreissena polymorpha]|uniref:Uncharacterized protein n=1 Tax=Dreissena polymorpha TaxID=45954 RepID=A0A9D4DFX9_DREPO|nr:hypothetical protein DPMN_182719 [Dreissena polymorpha]